MKAIPVSRPELKALLARIGGEAALERILVDFYARMAADTMIGFFFDGRDPRAIALQQMQFLLRAMGARESYAGKPPAQAHEQLAPILSGHFDRRLRLLEQTLEAHGVTEADRAIWVGFEEAFRDGIVAK